MKDRIALAICLMGVFGSTLLQAKIYTWGMSVHIKGVVLKADTVEKGGKDYGLIFRSDDVVRMKTGNAANHPGVIEGREIFINVIAKTVLICGGFRKTSAETEITTLVEKKVIVTGILSGPAGPTDPVKFRMEGESIEVVGCKEEAPGDSRKIVLNGKFVKISGKLVKKTFPAIDSYNKPETRLILVTDKPVDFSSGRESFYAEREIQVWFIKEFLVYCGKQEMLSRTLKPFVGKHLEVECVPTSGQTAHHHTNVIGRIESITEIDCSKSLVGKHVP